MSEQVQIVNLLQYHVENQTSQFSANSNRPMPEYSSIDSPKMARINDK